MNLVDAFVKKVISGPYEEYGKWVSVNRPPYVAIRQELVT